MIIALDSEVLDSDDGEEILEHIGDAFKAAIETIITSNLDVSGLPQKFQGLKTKREEEKQRPISDEEINIFKKIVLGDKNRPGLIDSPQYFRRVIDDQDDKS